MRKLDLILYFILITAIISFNSCKKIFDPTYEFIFYTSFEQESELNGWEGLSAVNLRNDAPESGGNKSIFVSGGCVIPTAQYTLRAVGVEQIVTFSCYGKNLTYGGTVSICLDNKYISIQVNDTTWTFYECKDSIIWPANKDLSICLHSGGFVGSSMLIDKIKVIKKK